MSKVCSKCKEEKDFSEFYFNSKDKKKLKSWCKSCHKKSSVEYNRRNKDKSRHYYLKYMYGISLEDYNKLFEEQGYCCAICGVRRHERETTRPDHNFSVDHNHDTGKLRGIICNECNRGLGYLKDSISNLQNAIEYLRKNDG